MAKGDLKYKLSIDTKKAQSDMSQGTKKMESGLSTFTRKVGLKFKDMFTIGAVMGIAQAAITGLLGAIGKGMEKATKNNKEFSTALTQLGQHVETLFVEIAQMLLPLIKALIGAGNFIFNLTSKSKLGGMSESTLKGYKEALIWNIENKKEDAKQTKLWKQALDEVITKLSSINAMSSWRLKNSKKQLDLQKAVAEWAKKAGDEQKKTLDEQEQAIGKITDSLKGIATDLLNLFPKDQFSKIANNLNEIITKIDGIAKASKEAGISIVEGLIKSLIRSGHWIQLVISGLAVLADAILSASKAQEELLNTQRRAAIDNRYADYLEKLRSKIEAVIGQLIVLNIIADRESIIRNKTLDDIDREIGAKEVLHAANVTLINDAIDAAKKVEKDYGYGLSLNPDDYQAYFDLATELEKPLDIKLNGRVIGQMKRPELEAQAKVLRKIGNDLKTASEAITTNLGLINDLEDLQLEKLTKQTAELEKQNALRDKSIDQRIKLGLLDAENLRDIQRIANIYSAAGLGGLDLAEKLTSYGISNVGAGRVVNLGSINVTNYEASGNVIASNIAGIIDVQLG